jgi:NADH:ubiquinone oxidoreductase subunit E
MKIETRDEGVKILLLCDNTACLMGMQSILISIKKL